MREKKQMGKMNELVKRTMLAFPSWYFTVSKITETSPNVTTSSLPRKGQADPCSASMADDP